MASTPPSPPETLDLRWKKTDYSLFLDASKCEGLADEFSDRIEHCNHALSHNLDWWFEPLSTRSNFASPLFHHYCCFHICLKLVKAYEFPKVCLTDCDVIHEGLLSLQKQGVWEGKIVHTQKRSPWAMFVKRFKAFGRTALHMLVPYLLVRMFHRRPPRKANAVLVDTFVVPGHESADRYYAGVLDLLRPEERSLVCLVPTFHGYAIRDYPRAIRAVLESGNAILFKESFLRFADYAFALGHAARLFFVRPPRMPVGVFDLGNLIREEMRRFGGFENAVIGFLNFRFTKCLRQTGWKLKHVVDWYENQGADRGWNYGFRFHFPDLPTVGYATTSLSQWHLATAPLPSERKRGVLPDCLKVPSRHLATAARKRDPELRVETTGGFRFSKPESATTDKTGPLRALVPLSYDLDLASHACRLARNLISPAAKEKVYLIFKPHPAADHRRVEALKTENITAGETWSTRTFPEDLARADAVLGCWTTSLLEAVVAGLPAGILPSPDGLFHNPIPEGAAEGWSFPVDSSETFAPLLAFARTCRNSPPSPPLDIFEPPTRKAALELLGLPHAP